MEEPPSRQAQRTTAEVTKGNGTSKRPETAQRSPYTVELGLGIPKIDDFNKVLVLYSDKEQKKGMWFPIDFITGDVIPKTLKIVTPEQLKGVIYPEDLIKPKEILISDSPLNRAEILSLPKEVDNYYEKLEVRLATQEKLHQINKKVADRVLLEIYSRITQTMRDYGKIGVQARPDGKVWNEAYDKELQLDDLEEKINTRLANEFKRLQYQLYTPLDLHENKFIAFANIFNILARAYREEILRLEKELGKDSLELRKQMKGAFPAMQSYVSTADPESVGHSRVSEFLTYEVMSDERLSDLLDHYEVHHFPESLRHLFKEMKILVDGITSKRKKLKRLILKFDYPERGAPYTDRPTDGTTPNRITLWNFLSFALRSPDLCGFLKYLNLIEDQTVLQACLMNNKHSALSSIQHASKLLAREETREILRTQAEIDGNEAFVFSADNPIVWGTFPISELDKDQKEYQKLLEERKKPPAPKPAATKQTTPRRSKSVSPPPLPRPKGAVKKPAAKKPAAWPPRSRSASPPRAKPGAKKPAARGRSPSPDRRGKIPTAHTYSPSPSGFYPEVKRPASAKPKSMETPQVKVDRLVKFLFQLIESYTFNLLQDLDLSDTVVTGSIIPATLGLLIKRVTRYIFTVKSNAKHGIPLPSAKVTNVELNLTESNLEEVEYQMQRYYPAFYSHPKDLEKYRQLIVQGRYRLQTNKITDLSGKQQTRIDEVDGADIDLAVLTEDEAEFDSIAERHFKTLKEAHPDIKMVKIDKIKKYLWEITGLPRKIQMYQSSLRQILTHHLAMVRGFIFGNGTERMLYCSANCLLSLRNLKSPNYYYFAGIKSPAEIILKYEQRGYLVNLPGHLRTLIGRYSRLEPRWQNRIGMVIRDFIKWTTEQEGKSKRLDRTLYQISKEYLEKFADLYTQSRLFSALMGWGNFDVGFLQEEEKDFIKEAGVSYREFNLEYLQQKLIRELENRGLSLNGAERSDEFEADREDDEEIEEEEEEE